MTADRDEPVSRRRFLAGLFSRRGEPESRPLSTTQGQIVAAFQALIERQKHLLAFGVPETELPAPPDDIRSALLSAASAEKVAARREALRDAYAALVWFCAGEDLDRLRAGKAALDALDSSPEGRRAIGEAYAVRTRKLADIAALRREFDRKVAAAPAAPTSS